MEAPCRRCCRHRTPAALLKPPPLPHPMLAVAVGEDVPRCAVPFQLGFPCAPNREGGARSHCLALQKEPKQRREGEKGRGGEEEMTAAGQERQHDRGKSQREWKWREWEEVCVAWNVLTFFISQLNWGEKMDIKTFQPLVLLHSSIIFKEQENWI